MMAENMFDGFDHTQYREEVEDRWGKDAYARGDAWWRGITVPGALDDPARALEGAGLVKQLEGIDELTVRDGLIAENNAFTDSMTFARQIGVLPPEGSRATERVVGSH